MKTLRDFFMSMVGRIFLILLIGIALAAWVATSLTNWRRQSEFERMDMAHVIERMSDHIANIQEAPAPQKITDVTSLEREKLRSQGDNARDQEASGLGGSSMEGKERAVFEGVPDPEFDRLAEASGLVMAAPTLRLSPEQCMSPRARQRAETWQRRMAESRGSEHLRSANMQLELPVCRSVQLRASDGQQFNFQIASPPIFRQMAAPFDPWIWIVLGLSLAGLAYWVAKMAATPLLRLSEAATELGRDLDREPLSEKGPSEVAQAAHAFNAMQARLQSNLRERTQMLAAITHDLQTPLTRLRLRLEKVEDDSLRDRLIGDLAAMQALIREGLDLARSTDSSESRMPLDLDSLLESVVEDAADAGADIAFDQRCERVLKLRPLAMRRVFSNLVDNALKYGGRATVRAWCEGREVMVTVTNPCASIPEDHIQSLFEPFVRLEASRSRDTGGVGLGLTIARTLAAREGAELTLANVVGGIEAKVHWRNAS